MPARVGLTAVASTVVVCGLFVWTSGPVGVADASSVSPAPVVTPHAPALPVPVIAGAQRVFLLKDFVETPIVKAHTRSTCRADLPDEVMTITIADISYSCPVYAGGQSVIDTGAATLITDQGASPLLALHPGDGGTLWIAAHHSTHGGPFAEVPHLIDGAIITVSDGGRTVSYRVVSRVHVNVRDGLVVDAAGEASDSATQDSVFRPDHGGAGEPRLLLQTCDGSNWRWLVYADLVAG
jgi:sortase (surface protein transpeptidase)